MRYADVLGYLPIVEKYGEEELPLKLSMRLGVRVALLRDVAEKLDLQRRALLRRISDKDADDKPLMKEGRFVVDAETFRAAWEEVLSDEAPVTLPAPLKLIDFAEVEKMSFGVMSAMTILGIVEESDG